jgi:hypothetical protein
MDHDDYIVQQEAERDQAEASKAKIHKIRKGVHIRDTLANFFKLIFLFGDTDLQEDETAPARSSSSSVREVVRCQRT